MTQWFISDWRRNFEIECSMHVSHARIDTFLMRVCGRDTFKCYPVKGKLAVYTYLCYCRECARNSHTKHVVCTVQAASILMKTLAHPSAIATIDNNRRDCNVWQRIRWDEIYDNVWKRTKGETFFEYHFFSWLWKEIWARIQNTYHIGTAYTVSFSV